MPGTRLTPEIEGELARVAEQNGCELLEATFAGGRLRLVLDREAGVTLGDCEAVSKDASALLDVLDFGRGQYTLEVSSPGLDRPLYGPRDYRRFVGRRVRIRHTDPETGRRATVAGRLASFDEGDGGRIELTETESRLDLEIRLADIDSARLEIEL